PVFNVRTIDEQIDRSMRTEPTFAMLSSTFGILALGLSAVGLYGVIANAVSRRRKELGIRLAPGAEPRRILRLVLGEAGVLVALGVAVGLPCALLSGRAMRILLFGIQSGEGKRGGRPPRVVSSPSRCSRGGFGRAGHQGGIRGSRCVRNRTSRSGTETSAGRL